uniref:Uncharacterized protein n=1 Tax=Oryza glumipatula TaxID=40148 RepID=A0A0E0B9W4_9ORYZ
MAAFCLDLLWESFSWDLGDVGGAMAWSAKARVDRNGEVADGGALDTEDADELDTRCSIHAKG